MNFTELEHAVLQDIEQMQPQVLELIETMCAIPAPSHHEELRAAFVREWFVSRGMHAEIDEAKNVRIPMGLDEHEDIVVVMAHMDTVFPDMEPMPFSRIDGKLCCPGVGDNTTNLAAMMLMAQYLNTHGYQPRCGVLFVADSCEEGLGNLKGCKAIMHAYGSRVKAFLALDGGVEDVCTQAVGSARYRITAKTRGGHSFADFGQRNAIAVLAGIIGALYQQQVPQEAGSTTTYNVGTIQGGTSVNTIAQQAEMLYEYRSDSAQCLAVMESQLRAVLAAQKVQDAQVELELLGLRPCSENVDPVSQQQLTDLCSAALAHYVGEKPELLAASTDCNIPLSMGVPSACFGVYRGKGAHTREEWVEADSICSGMKAAFSVIESWFEKR